MDASRITNISLSFTYRPEDENPKALFHIGDDHQYMSMYTSEDNLNFKILVGKNPYNVYHTDLKPDAYYDIHIERY